MVSEREATTLFRLALFGLDFLEAISTMLLIAKMLDFGTEKGVKNEHSFSYVSFFTTHFRVKRCICRPKGIVEIASTLLHQGKRTIPGIEYTNSTVDAIYHAEGRAVKDGSTWDHEYVITDHLGNTRVRFHDDNGNGTISSGELLSTHDYYPFGMEWNASSYKYTYNGKEKNTELGLELLNYGARMYDPVIGRWGQVDPMANDYHLFSTYCYVGNMPTKSIDPDGKRIIFINGFLGGGSPQGGATYWQGRRSSFVSGAQRFFKDYQNPYFTNYNFKYSKSSTIQRRNSGYEYAKQNYQNLVKGMSKKDDVFHIISHSMGGAFSEGIMEYLKSQGWTIETMVYFNA